MILEAMEIDDEEEEDEEEEELEEEMHVHPEASNRGHRSSDQSIVRESSIHFSALNRSTEQKLPLVCEAEEEEGGGGGRRGEDDGTC
jgi:hypothetical protein